MTSVLVLTSLSNRTERSWTMVIGRRPFAVIAKVKFIELSSSSRGCMLTESPVSQWLRLAGSQLVEPVQRGLDVATEY